MAKNKTTETDGSVMEYINSIANESRRKDCTDLLVLFTLQTGFLPKMWGSSIVGFGSYHYRYESGHEGDAPLTGFSCRSQAIVLYLSPGFEKRKELLLKLGKHKQGKGCVYIQKLSDINADVLSEMISRSGDDYRNQYPAQVNSERDSDV